MSDIFDKLSSLIPRKDRLQHFFAFSLFSFALATFAPLNFVLAICIALSFLKEIYDTFKTNKTGFDIVDFAFGVLPSLLIYLIF